MYGLYHLFFVVVVWLVWLVGWFCLVLFGCIFLFFPEALRGITLPWDCELFGIQVVFQVQRVRG